MDEAGIPDRYHDYLYDYQSIFTPVILQKGQNQTFTLKDRLPYVGTHLTAQEGSSGIVYTRKIAPYHWEVQLPNGGYTPAETEFATILALKVFNGGRSGQEARADFKIEQNILEELRNSNFAHKMILLDWGSITIQDEQGTPIECALIFDCATYSLEEFLMGTKGVDTSWTASLLLAKLADIVQALACLHDNFDTVHLDVNPDNILVFVKMSADGPTLEWKISDFGLARKRTAKPRSGHLLDFNRSTSQSASLIATRNAGRYQAPEIQQRNSSKAGQKSNVWSMGCVALMVLGFAIDGPNRVTNLTNGLRVEYENAAGVDSFFYVTSDSYEWRYATEWKYYNCQYLDEYKPDPGNVPGMRQLEAAVHPYVVEWSNVLYRYCRDKPEEPLLKSMLQIIFRGVLLINMGLRIKAIEFYRLLAEVQRDWKQMENGPKSSNENEGETTQSVAAAIPQQRNGVENGADVDQMPNSPPTNTNASRRQQPPRHQNNNAQNGNTLPTRSAVHGQMLLNSVNGPTLREGSQSPERSLAFRAPRYPVNRVEDTTEASAESAMTLQPDTVLVPDISEHSKLCLSIMQIKAANTNEHLKLESAIQDELLRDSELVRMPCPRSNCQRHPIHVAIRNKSYVALEILLNTAYSSDLSIPCPGCGGRTIIEEACESYGDGRALGLFKRYFSDLKVSREFYNAYKNNLGQWARDALKELTKPSKTPVQRQRPPRESLLRRVFTSNSNTSNQD